METRELASLWRRLLYSKIVDIFEYDNLPEEINEQAFKLMLFKFGKIVFYKIGEKFLVQPFSYTSELDWYYIPKYGRVVNPWLPIEHQNFDFEINNECVVWCSTPDIYNIKTRGLVSDIIFKTANQLAENDISYYCIQRNSRLIAIFLADNDIERVEANRVLEKMFRGDSDITMSQDIVNRITTSPISENTARGKLTELIEFQQYVLANFYHAFGVNSNYNLKREQLNTSEIDVNKEVLSLNIEDMLKMREKGVKKINDTFGLNIGVYLNERVYKTLIESGDTGNIGNSRVPVKPEAGANEEEIIKNTMENRTSEDEDKSSDISVIQSGRGNSDADSDDKQVGTDIEPEEEVKSSSDSTVKVSVETEVKIDENDSNLSERNDENDENDKK